MSLRRWTSTSTYRLAGELTRGGHRVDADTVGRLLKDRGASLQANVKRMEGSAPPERDAQFRHSNTQVARFRRRGWPVISVDAKKKERIRAITNPGRTWRRVGLPEPVEMHVFPQFVLGTAIPYGTYDLQRTLGSGNIGTTHATAEFAVESIRRWWQRFGRRHSHGPRICSSGPRGAAATGAGAAPGSSTSRTWRPAQPCESPCATSPRAPASGTRWSTGWSRSST